MSTVSQLSADEKRLVTEGKVEEEGGYVSPWALKEQPSAPTGKQFKTYAPVGLAVTGVLGVLGFGIFRFLRPKPGEDSRSVQAKWMGNRVWAQAGAVAAIVYFAYQSGRFSAEKEKNPALSAYHPSKQAAKH